MADQYDQFASDYDWVFSDFARAGERQLKGLSKTLASLPANSKILDCACGTGVTTFALARQGYHVTGTDASEGMILQARRHGADTKVNVSFRVCSWENLPSLFGPEFDLVLCAGNSIGHCRNAEDMLDSLRGIHNVLKPGGWLVLDTRNWEKLVSERVRFTHFGPRQRGGKRCVPLYVWTFPEKPGDPVIVEVVLPIEENDTVTLRTYEITYYPFGFAELMERLQRVGFVDVDSDYEAESAGYTVTARRERPQDSAE